ncbi:hypothetical protein [Amycolatopsis sp. NBC_01480]|uniref:hypothetical protein n=1 Tax=Amycolatopsis sp. NBC_01480 TaxID=2903562 RepID=UPI002E2CBE7E|nr:hypothetical protein [Amycolatopsis sp. NBC_01480]
MADDNNSKGFTSDDNGVWPDSSTTPTNSTGDPSKDFAGMTWKQIEAAILGGGSMAPGQAQADQAYSNVNWQSLQAAAGVFQTTQLNLAMVSQAIKDQTAALAGGDGPWKGTAATNFKTMMDNMAAKFDGLVHQITDGGNGGRNVPTQLVNSAAYLQWAQNTLRYIDSYYAQQVIERGKVLNDGRAYISQFPDAVEMMTNDMRKVGDQLSGKYHSFSTASNTSSTPPPPGGGGGDMPPPPVPPPPPPVPPPPDAPPPPAVPPPTPPPVAPPPPNVPPPGGGNVPPPNVPPPPGGTGGGPGGGGTPPPLNSANVPPPPGDTGGGPGGGGGTPPPFKNLAVSPPPGSGPGSGPGTNPASIPPPPGDTGGGPGSGPGAIPPLTSPNIPAPPGSGPGSGPGAKDNTKGLGDIKPPALNGPPGDTGGSNGLGGTNGLGSNGLGNIKSPSLGGPPGDLGGSNGLGGANGLGNTNGLTNNALNPAQLPPSLQNPPGDTKGGGMPMMPPGGMGAGGAGGNGSGAERPDSSGLLGGIDKPWIPNPPNGIGDPNALGQTPPLNPASWAPPPGDVGTGGSGTGGPGTSGINGLGSTGSGPSGLGDIKGLDPSQFVPPPGLNDQNLNGQQLPGGQQGPGSPMMPPGGMGAGGAGANGSSAERPDSAGLLGGVNEPWNASTPDGIGDPSSFGETPPLNPASWAPPPGDVGTNLTGAGTGLGGATGSDPGLGDIKGLDPSQFVAPPGLNSNGQQLPGGQQSASSPMMPPGGMGAGGAGANGSSAERPDSAGLLGGVNEPWNASTPDGIGDPSSFGETPPLNPASWAPPPGTDANGLSGADSGLGDIKGLNPNEFVAPPGLNEQIPNGQQSASSPMMPPGGMGAGGAGANGSGAERPDSAGLLGGVNEPWNASTANGVGDPSSFGDTPPLQAASWASGDPGTADLAAATNPGDLTSPSDLTAFPPTPGVPTAAPGMPMSPPPAGAAANGSAVERPDSAGLLNGVSEPWSSGPVPAVGDPSAVSETPPGTGWSAQPPAAVPGWGTQPVEHQSTSDVPVTPFVQPGWGVADPGEPSRDRRDKAMPGDGPSDGIVRIAVVQPAEADDTSAWDVGTAEFLPGLLPASMPVQPAEREEDLTTDLVERTDEPWRPAEDAEAPRATYQRLRSGQGEFIPDELPTCGDGPPPEPEPEVSEKDTPADGEEEEERTMADLLSQDGNAWGGPASKPSGVLE